MNSSPGAPSVPGLMQITALTQMLYSRHLPGIGPHQCGDDDGDAIAVIHKMRNTHGDTPVTLGAGGRRGVRQFYGTIGAHPEPDIPLILRVNPHVDARYYSDLDWNLETRELSGGLQVTFMDGSVFTLGYENNFERLAEPTDIAGVQVPTGEYDFRTKTVKYQSSGERSISGTVGYTQGGFYDGDRKSISGNLQYRPSHHLALQIINCVYKENRK